MSLFNKRENIGFTLIELATVIAIIGVLTAIALPQFNALQARQRTSEARVSLGRVYALETAFQADTNSYASCLSDMGYVAKNAGNRYYLVGFRTADRLARNAGRLNGVTCSNTKADGVSYFSADTGLGGPPVTNPTAMDANTKARANTFLAGAAANLGGNARPNRNNSDFWTIDENQTITNVRQGF